MLFSLCICLEFKMTYMSGLSLRVHARKKNNFLISLLSFKMHKIIIFPEKKIKKIRVPTLPKLFRLVIRNTLIFYLALSYTLLIMQSIHIGPMYIVLSRDITVSLSFNINAKQHVVPYSRLYLRKGQRTSALTSHILYFPMRVGGVSPMGT